MKCLKRISYLLIITLFSIDLVFGLKCMKGGEGTSTHKDAVKEASKSMECGANIKACLKETKTKFKGSDGEYTKRMCAAEGVDSDDKCTETYPDPEDNTIKVTTCLCSQDDCNAANQHYKWANLALLFVSTICLLLCAK